MLQRLAFSLAVLPCVSVAAAAEAPSIEHQAVACAVANRFPQLAARFAPAQSVGRARVLFQPDGGRHWYGVVMQAVGPDFTAVLPRPKKSLRSYRYYLEVTDTALGTGRTPEYTTRVAANVAGCAQAKMAGGLGSAAVTLEVPAGAPALPVGFSANGVIAVAAVGAAAAAGAGATAAGATAAGATVAAAAGGGIPTAVLIGGGLAVAGAGAALAGGAGGGEGRPVTYAGPFSGQFTILLVFTNGVDAGGRSIVCGGTTSIAGSVTVTLDEGSGPVNGTIHTDGTSTPVSGECPASFPLAWTEPLTGNAGAFSARGQRGPTTSPGAAISTITYVLEFSGALSGGVINGTLTFTSSHEGLQPSGLIFAGNTAVTMPVTLR